MAEAEVEPEAEVESEPRTVAKPPLGGLYGHSADRLSNVGARTTSRSVELLKSLETGGLAAIDAAGKFVIAIEDGLIEEVNSTSAVAKTFVIATEGSLTEQVNSTSAVVRKFVAAIPDALTEQVTATSGVVKKLVIAIEDAVTDEITGTATVAKKITVSGFEIADRVVRLEHDALRDLIQGAAQPPVVQNGTKRPAAQ